MTVLNSSETNQVDEDRKYCRFTLGRLPIAWRRLLAVLGQREGGSLSHHVRTALYLYLRRKGLNPPSWKEIRYEQRHDREAYTESERVARARLRESRRKESRRKYYVQTRVLGGAAAKRARAREEYLKSVHWDFRADGVLGASDLEGRSAGYCDERGVYVSESRWGEDDVREALGIVVLQEGEEVLEELAPRWRKFWARGATERSEGAT